LIVFELAPLQEFVETETSREEISSGQNEIDTLPLSDLRARALAASVSSRNPLERKQDYYLQKSDH